MTKKNKSDIKPFKVRLFAISREMAGGKTEIELEFEQKSVKLKDLEERILQVYPQMKSIPFVLAVNCKIVTEKQPTDIPGNSAITDTTAITADDEIAVLPPISGG
jgi:molybdopterin converting factor small subunit